MSEGQVAGRWLEHVRAMCKRFSAPGLSALLAVEVVLIFLMFPLAAAEGFDLPLVVTVAIAAGLIFLVLLGSDNRGALVVAVVAAGCTLLAGGWNSSGQLPCRRPRPRSVPCSRCSPPCG